MTAFLDGLPGSGLSPNTEYFYQLVAVGGGSTVNSPVENFTTLGFDTSLVVQQGDMAPGTNVPPSMTDALYQDLGAPSVNNSDGVAFSATLATNKTLGVGRSNDLGIWADDGGGTLQLIARTGGAAPGVANALYTNLGDVVYNENSQVAFAADLSRVPGEVTPSTSLSIWSNMTGPVSLIAREGDTLSAISSTTTLNSISELAMSDANTIVVGTITTAASPGVKASTNNSILEGTLEDHVKSVFKTGDMVLAGSGTKTISSFVVDSTLPLVGGQPRSFASNTGDLAVLTDFTDATTGIVKGVSSTQSLSLAVLSGSNLVTGTGTATYSKFGNPIINTNDDIAFLTSLTLGKGGITASNDTAILADDNTGTLQLVAQTGDPTFGYLSLSNPVYNDNEAVAFIATYKVGKSVVTGIFCNSTGTVQRVIQTGDAAPGCPAGVVFRSFASFALPDAGGSTNHGGVTFLATVAGTGVSTGNSTGIWSVDSSGALQLIVRTGDELLPGKKVIDLTYLASSESTGAQPVSFAKNGDLVYLATFSDSTNAIFSVVFP